MPYLTRKYGYATLKVLARALPDLGQVWLVAHDRQLRKCESCGERVTVNCCDCLVSQTINER